MKPPAGSLSVDLSIVSDADLVASERLIAIEAPISIEFNGLAYAVMMATPADLEDFAYGFSITEGVVTRAEEVLDVDIYESELGWIVRIEVAAERIVTSGEGLQFHLRTPWGTRDVRSPLLGRFNVANLLTVVACLGALGESFERIVAAVESLAPVNGRMNRLGDGLRQPLVVVDYAHTPDALEQALTALRAHCAGRLLCVFGCGGERDAGKRPEMGAIAERLADLAIVTDDNPRGEDGDAIVAQIVAGMASARAMTVERDRASAIGHALQLAKPGDVVLIAGKGHETYQDGAAGKRPFDDLAVARAALEACA